MVSRVVTKKWVLRLFAGSWATLFALAAWVADGLSLASTAGLLLAGLAFFFACGLIAPTLMVGPYRLIDWLLAPVGRIFSFLILALVYFMIFTLFAMALRLLRWNPLRLRRARWPDSGWIERPRAAESADYRWQY